MIGYNTHALNDPFCQLTLSNRYAIFKTMKPHPPTSTSNEEILENEKKVEMEKKYRNIMEK